MEAPGEKLVIRLWDTIFDKGIGGLLAPWQTRRKNRAAIDGMRQELLNLAQAEQEVKDIRAGRKALDAQGRLVDILPQGSPSAGATVHDQTAASIAARNRIARDMRAELNTSKALLIAEGVLEDDPQDPPEEVVDDDWLFRWREAASMVSSEELQQLWGRALAGEIKSPGSCSLRTLEFLKNLSHDEAQEISDLARFVISTDLIVSEPASKAILEAKGITDRFLLKLQDLGVVSGLEGIEGVGWYREIGSSESEQFTRGLVAYDRVLLVRHEDSTKKLKLNGCFVTSLGQQVLKLGSFKPHEGYLRGVGKAIARKGFKVYLARFQRLDSSTLQAIEPEEIPR